MSTEFMRCNGYKLARALTRRVGRLLLGGAIIGGILATGSNARAADWPMWALTPLRNAVCPDKDPHTDWDIKTGKNILWSAALGSKSYGNPIVSNGMVFIGTNNEGTRD